MPIIELTQSDLNHLRDAHTVVTLPSERCEDIDGHGSCYCVSPEPDPTDTKSDVLPRRHLVCYGANPDGSAHTSRRYFRL